VIFTTVGAQLPFDRLIHTVDEWARSRGRHDVFAQVGDTSQHPRSIHWRYRLSPCLFEKAVSHASVVIAHAGMGSILVALRIHKPIIVLPRRADLHETRNDHQIATARTLSEMGLVHAAYDTDELRRVLDHVEDLRPGRRLGDYASSELIEALRTFINGPQAVLAPTVTLAPAAEARIQEVERCL
jgi:UDP-N-acetylglucosamine transferase subunit ALG13